MCGSWKSVNSFHGSSSTKSILRTTLSRALTRIRLTTFSVSRKQVFIIALSCKTFSLQCLTVLLPRMEAQNWQNADSRTTVRSLMIINWCAIVMSLTTLTNSCALQTKPCLSSMADFSTAWTKNARECITMVSVNVRSQWHNWLCQTIFSLVRKRARTLTSRISTEMPTRRRYRLVVSLIFSNAITSLWKKICPLIRMCRLTRNCSVKYSRIVGVLQPRNAANRQKTDGFFLYSARDCAVYGRWKSCRSPQTHGWW